MALRKYFFSKQGLLFLLAGVIAFISSCNDFKKNKSHKNVPDSIIAKGKERATIYCQSCHKLPDPSMLDSKSWEEGVMPNMGPYLGIFNDEIRQYPSYRNDSHLPKNFYPAKPMMSLLEWKYIKDYYAAASPDSLPEQSRDKAINLDLPGFEIKQPPKRFENPAVTFIKIDTVSGSHRLLLYDITQKAILSLDTNLNAIDSLRVNTPVVAADINKDNIAFCNIGEMNPNNGRFGKLQSVNTTTGLAQSNAPVSLADSLARPVSFQAADLNGDGKLDYLVCEFGHLTGELAWFENNGNNSFKKHVLRNLPGAIATVINDYNNDGRPDIWVLFAQGDEGIFVFTNKGNGSFESKRILTFPPMQGSTYFELDDFNKDGHPDILYTCGDNADFSPVLKPYHGVYVFLNNGSNAFTQKYFFPIHGCFKAMARDYDNDGDLDIAAISFFADYNKQPEEGFVYLKNEGDFNFDPFSFPGAKSGRWLTMDVADFNGDGKPDIVLGNFSIGPLPKMTSDSWRQGPSLILLKNINK